MKTQLVANLGKYWIGFESAFLSNHAFTVEKNLFYYMLYSIATLGEGGLKRVVQGGCVWEGGGGVKKGCKVGRREWRCGDGLSHGSGEHREGLG